MKDKLFAKVTWQTPEFMIALLLYIASGLYLFFNVMHPDYGIEMLGAAIVWILM